MLIPELSDTGSIPAPHRVDFSPLNGYLIHACDYHCASNRKMNEFNLRLLTSKQMRTTLDLLNYGQRFAKR